MNDTAQATTEVQEPTTDGRVVNYTFRTISAKDADKFQAAEAEFKEAGVEYDLIKDKVDGEEVVVGIKRKTVAITLPIISVEQFTPEFIQSLINDQLEQAVRKEFVDNYKDVPVDELTAQFVESALASKRTAAISAEQVEALAKVVSAFLAAKSIPETTIKVIKDMIEGKFGKRVLKSYISLKDQFLSVLSNIELAIQSLPESEQADHMAVLTLFVDNYERFNKEAEETPLELNLL